MTTLPEKMRLKGLAEEDVYFARRDRELIEAMHRRRDLAAAEQSKTRQTGPPPTHRDPPGIRSSLRRLVARALQYLRGRRR